jgi:hypothetical protein
MQVTSPIQALPKKKLAHHLKKRNRSCKFLTKESSAFYGMLETRCPFVTSSQSISAAKHWNFQLRIQVSVDFCPRPPRLGQPSSPHSAQSRILGLLLLILTIQLTLGRALKSPRTLFLAKIVLIQCAPAHTTPRDRRLPIRHHQATRKVHSEQVKVGQTPELDKKIRTKQCSETPGTNFLLAGQLK